MSTPKDGGPAFPSPDTRGYDGVPGMTLRDYFAGRALHAYLSMELTTKRIAGGEITALETAGACYEWADLMLTACERKEDA